METRSFKPNVRDFSDYRQYLRAWFLDQKSKKASMSLAVVAKRVGMSRMAVKYLIDSKRHLDTQKAERFAEALGCDGGETEYFCRLVHFNKANDEKSRDHSFQRLIALASDKFKSTYLEGVEQLKLFEDWYIPVLSEMSYIKGFQKDSEWISSHIVRPKTIKAECLKQALQFLTRQGLLKGCGREFEKQKVPQGLYHHAHQRYQKKKIEVGAEALIHQRSEAKEFFHLTISVDAEKMLLAKKMIQEFRHKLHDTLAGDADSDRVIQINMQLFTVASLDKNDLF